MRRTRCVSAPRAARRRTACAASTRLQAVGVVRHHGDGGKLAGDLAAGAVEAAAVAHGRAAAAVRPAVQQQPHVVAAIDRLGIVPAQQEAFASARSSVPKRCCSARQRACVAGACRPRVRAVRSTAHIQMFTSSCARGAGRRRVRLAEARACSAAAAGAEQLHGAAQRLARACSIISVIRIVHTAGARDMTGRGSSSRQQPCCADDKSSARHALCQRCRPPSGSERNTENVECCGGQAGSA